MKQILITGGSGGIGLVVMNQLLGAGYSVINLDQHVVELEDPNYLCIPVDLRNVEALFEVVEQLPHVDGLINNAAISNNSAFLDMAVDEFKDVLDVNVTSHVLLSQWYAKQFQGTHGRIINIASTRAFMSEPNTIPYTVSKGAIISLTHGLAITLQHQDITVNAIAPGWIDTTNEPLREEDHLFHPSNRVGQPEDIGYAILFLLDEHQDFINGEVITIDGGVTKKMIYPE